MVNTVTDTLSELSQSNIYVYVDKGKLKTRSSKEALTPYFVNLIKNNKEQLISHLQNADALHSNEASAILPRAHSNAPLSYAQNRLWMIDKIENGSAQFNLVNLLKCKGKIDKDILRLTFEKIIDRHHVLRSNVVEAANGEPYQHLQDDFSFKMEEIDISAVSPDEKDAQVKILLQGMVKQTFDLCSDLMLRVLFIQLEEQDAIIAIVQHHIASDGWSMGLFIQEVSTIYSALLQNSLPELAPLTIQYADYAAWQRGRERSASFEKSLTFWETQLADIPLVHSLPLDRPRQKTPSYNGALVSGKLTAKQLVALKSVCQENGATVFMGLQVALSVLIARYSSHKDIVIGTPIANREQLETENLIGFFVNTIALRADLSGNPTFLTLLEKSKKTTLDAYENADVPFDYVVDRVVHNRSTQYSPLFQIMLVLQNADNTDIHLPGLSLESMSVDEFSTSAQYDLTLEVIQGEQGLDLHWEYSSDIFEQSSIQRLAVSFEAIVDQMVSSIDSFIDDVNILSTEDSEAILNHWNSTYEKVDDTKSIHQLVEEHSAVNPNNIALVYEDAAGNRSELTYDQLNARANQLARHLREAKIIGDNSLVGVCLQRSPEMIISMLAIVKAGGAYLPLDPEYPQSRLDFIIDDAGLGHIITQGELATKLSLTINTAYCIDDIDVSQDIARQSSDNINLEEITVTSADIAYAVYSSGSSGKPKCAQLNHLGLVNLSQHQLKALNITTESKILQFASLAFDAATWEWVMALANGASLYLMSNDVFASNTDLSNFVARNHISHATLPPAILPALERKAWQSVHTLIIAGEACPKSIADDWRQGRRLINAYGPSEVTVCATMGDYIGHTLHIGKPIQNVTTYVLEKNLNLTPIGCVGELYIGGVGLARGYLNRGELTVEKFIDNPFYDASMPGSSKRLYKTGDLVRWLPEGNLEFLGRCDDQVKVRGFRVELGEIEASINAMDGVKRSFVTASRNDSSIDTELIAYVVMDANNCDVMGLHSATKTEENKIAQQACIDFLRQGLRKLLPTYMLPASFALLSEFPLTSHGKINRNALKKAEISHFQSVYIAPATETEEILCFLWQDILAVDRVGTSDNFFDLGGNSLVAMRMAAEINLTFYIQLPIKDIFEFQTIEPLAKLVDRLDAGVSPSGNTISLVAREGELKTSYGQQRLWMLNKIDGGNAHYNLHSAFKLCGEICVPALKRSFETIVERHEVLRTVFAIGSDGKPLQQVLDSKLFTVDEYDYSGRGNTSHDHKDNSVDSRELHLSELLRNEASRDFNLESDMMLRTAIVRMAEHNHVLIVTMNHIAADGWSMSILVDEFCELYTAYCSDRDNPLKTLEIQYVDYANWQVNRLQGDALEDDLLYWEQQLKDAPTIHQIPLDMPRPEQQTFAGDVVRSEIDGETTLALENFCGASGATLFMGLHAVFAILLSRYSNETDIVIGTSSANREQVEVSKLIGFFVNNLVLRSDLSAATSFQDLLEQSKTTLLDAYSRQQIPFEKVVERLQPRRSMSHSPLFQIMLVLQNTQGTTIDLPNLDVGPVSEASDGNIAKYELTLDINKNENGLQLNWEYNTDLFFAESIERMAANFASLLDALIASPHENIFSIDFIHSTERASLLSTWNNTVESYPKDLCIHEIFERQADKTPDACAIIFDDLLGHESQLTYDELNCRANALAHLLRERRRVKPDTLIGVLLPRSPDLMVAIMAILKAGGAYLPLDCRSPDARLAYIIQDSNVDFIISDLEFVAKQCVANKQTIVLNDPALVDELKECQTSNLDKNQVSLSSDALAYCIYTSGSTGKPKGTLLIHSALMNLAFGQITGFSIEKNSTILQFASIAFDAATSEWACAFASGASLLMTSEEVCRSAKDLSTYVEKHQITHATLPPTLLPILEREKWRTVSTLIVAGETCARTLADDWALNRNFINAYGPTEATVCASLGSYRSLDSTLTIGKPIQNVQLYVLNHEKVIAPVNTFGELYIGGDGLARGYLNQDILTQERFVNCQLHGAKNERLYMTGDKVRWLADGRLEFSGRLDQQVKIRGHRVELGEIENALQNVKDVIDVVVVARDMLESTQLVAYIIAQATTSTDANTGQVNSTTDVFYEQTVERIKQYLKDTLPDYMLPAHYVFLEKFPLTTNGKIDKKSLPDPQKIFAKSAYTAPRTATEKALCDIWQTLLGVDKVGIRDDFFDLGGHSLLIIKLVNIVKEKFELDIPIKVVFQFSDIESAASYIDVFKNTAENLEKDSESETFTI